MKKKPIRGYCCICREPIYDSIDPSRAVECGLCVQKRVKHIERIELEAGMEIKNRVDYSTAVEMARNNPTPPTGKRKKVAQRGCTGLEWAKNYSRCRLPVHWEDM